MCKEKEREREREREAGVCSALFLGNFISLNKEKYKCIHYLCTRSFKITNIVLKSQ